MKKNIILGLVVMIILFFIISSLFSGNKDENVNAPSPIPNPVSPSVGAPQSTQAILVAENLEDPNSMAFLPDGGMMITERSGRIRLIESSGILQYNPIGVIDNVKEVGSGGLLGIAIHPEYSANNYVFIYFTYDAKRSTTYNKILRLKYYNGELIDGRTILDQIPGSLNSNGGRIKFGPDNYLYITTGDTENPSQAQDLNSLSGKILRITDEGKPVPDNPFGSGSLIFSYGHHNSFGLAWDRWDIWAKMWETETGTSNPSGYDEINIIEAGKNYGWPFITGDKTEDDVVVPVKNSGASSAWGPGGAAFAGSSLFFGGQNKILYEAVIEGHQIKELKEHFKNKYGPVNDVVLGPENMIYFSTDSKIYKVKPVRIID